jgi:hypothetical protein
MAGYLKALKDGEKPVHLQRVRRPGQPQRADSRRMLSLLLLPGQKWRRSIRMWLPFLPLPQG